MIYRKALLFAVSIWLFGFFITEEKFGTYSAAKYYFLSNMDSETVGVISVSDRYYRRGVRRGQDMHYDISYSYEVGGNMYTASQVNYSTSRTDSLEVLSKYPLGKEVTVFYDSKKPSFATLEDAALHGDIWFTLLGHIFIAVAGGVMVIKFES